MAGGVYQENARFADAMTGILVYAPASTGDQDVPGQTLRLTQAGAIKVFTVVRHGLMDRPRPVAPVDYARKGDTLAVAKLDRLGRTWPPMGPIYMRAHGSTTFALSLATML